MATADPVPHINHRATALERWLQRPGVQRWAAIFLSVAGLAGAAAFLYVLVKVGQDTRLYRTSALAVAMSRVQIAMFVLLILVSGAMGLFLAIRGHRKALPRLLALSCAFVSALFGVWIGMTTVMNQMMDPRQSFDVIMWLAFATTVALAVVFFFGCFGVLYFLAAYPKPVRLLGTEFGAEGAPLRTRIATKWSGSWLTSPQFAALVAGTAGILLLGHALDHTRGTTHVYAAYYLACWIPFAVIAAKQPLLGEEDRRSVRWVFLGQTVWLVFFLVSLLATLALVVGGALTFANWNHSNAFAGGFFTFFFAGFVIVLLATLAFSIFHDGTFDPDLVIRRTWVLAAVGLVFGGMFVVFERLLAEGLARWLGVSTANALTVVAALTAGVVYPLRSALEQRVRGFIEHWRAAQAIADGARQQAVIVFADLSGYTALTERNEREALIMAAVFHRDAQQLAAAEGGKLIKTIGDAVLMRFTAADAAFRATWQLKRRFTEKITAMGMSPLPIHAGIHAGEIVEGPSGDVFGSTVNVAARLLGTAGAEEIVASRAAVEAANAAEEARFLGGKKLKNVENPVDCFLLAAPA